MKLAKGGIGMIDIHIFDKALKLTWVRRYFNSPASWKLLFGYFKEIFESGETYH